MNKYDDIKSIYREYGKYYRLLKSRQEVEEKIVEINSICREYGINGGKRYYSDGFTINDDMSINVHGSVRLSRKRLDQLPLKFKKIDGSFDCSNNLLFNLDGSPEIVKFNFSCGNNDINSLKGGPKIVERDFSCVNNQLTSLEGCPEVIGGGLYCSNNKITSFEGLPEFFEQKIIAINNPINEIYKLFKEDSRCIYWIREFGAIQGGEVVRDRLEEVYHTLGMDIPNNITLKEYVLV